MQADFEGSLHSNVSKSDPGSGTRHAINGKNVLEQESADESHETPVEKKRRGQNVQREWVEVNCWMRDDDFGDNRIRQLINCELRELARKAGGQ